MPAKGISLHLGLNYVDPRHYDGWNGELAACEFDAKDMRKLAVAQGFAESGILLRSQVTAEAVKEAIADAARKLSAGDLFLLTYSGHGAQIPDKNSDEPDRQDETWVLWNRQLVDDELWALWARFKAGVRIVVLSDSCHSGTVSRAMPAGMASDGPGPRVRWLPTLQALKVYRLHATLYDDIQKSVPAGEKSPLKATVILISGCQDNQFSQDGDRNGLFTGTLKKVWKKGKFEGGYRKLRDLIAQRMPPQQTPNYSVVGRANRGFEDQKPFTI